MEPPATLTWDGAPANPEPKDIYTIHNWSAVDEAVRLYRPDKVVLAVHPNASLRFANEFIREFKIGSGAKDDGYPVLNPGMAYCKSEVFECLQPHVKSLEELAKSIRSQIRKVEALVREMIFKHADAKRGVFETPSPEAKVLQPLPQPQQVYLQVTSNRGLDLIAAAAKKHLPVLPEKCTTVAEMASSQPSEADVQTELYEMNLQFLQGQLKLLSSFEEQVKKVHFDMDDLLLGNTSVGSARTVMDFVDVNLMIGKAIRTGDAMIKTGDMSPKSSAIKTPGKSPIRKQSPRCSPANKTASKSPTWKQSPKCSSANKTASKSPTNKPFDSQSKTSDKSPKSAKKRARIDKSEYL